MLLLHLYKTFFLFFIFPIMVMYILNIASTIKKWQVRYFIFASYYKQIGFVKENSYYSMKRLKRKYLSLLETKLIRKQLILVMLKNTINHFKKQNHKISKTIKNNYSAIKNFWKIVDIISVILKQKFSRIWNKLKEFPK